MRTISLNVCYVNNDVDKMVKVSLAYGNPFLARSWSFLVRGQRDPAIPGTVAKSRK